MSRGFNSRYREPNVQEVRKIAWGGYRVTDLFDDEEIADLLAVARRRIIACFVNEREFVRGQWRLTDNYIAGVRNKQSALSHHIVINMRRHFIKYSQLPSQLQYLNRRWRDRLVQQLESDIVLMQLNIMCSKPLFEIYFDEYHGIWQMIQSVVDEHYQMQDFVRKVKFDCRNEHGMVRTQRINRGRPAGASTSMANDVRVAI